MARSSESVSDLLQHGAAANITTDEAHKAVQAVVRVRPQLPREYQVDNAVEVLSDNDIVVFKQDAEFASSYDRVFGAEATQLDVYTAAVHGGIRGSAQGINCTVLAYGQTGTGKTHTMLGPPGVDPLAMLGNGAQAASECPRLGVIPRAAQDLFQELRAREAAHSLSFTVFASYLEIYNDQLVDLLAAHTHKKGQRPPPAPAATTTDQGPDSLAHPSTPLAHQPSQLEVREDRKHGGTYVHGARVVRVSNLAALLALVRAGSRQRAVRHTDMNACSSRSHAILQLIIEQRPKADAGVGVAQIGAVASEPLLAVRSKLNFVDLAGSERWNKADAAIGLRATELTAINSSLSTLAKVVAAVHERGSTTQHIPYRDCKLTHLLQDSLGGNCRTVLIATVSPSIVAFDETVSTLKFADRTRAITNNPTVNTSRDYASVIALKEREIGRLRHLLASFIHQQPGGVQKSAPHPDTRDQHPHGQACHDAVAAPPDGGIAAGVGRSTTDAATHAVLGQLLVEVQQLRTALDLEREKRAQLEAQVLATCSHVSSPVRHVTAAGEGESPQVSPAARLRSSATVVSSSGTWAAHAFSAVLARRAEVGQGLPRQTSTVRRPRSTPSSRAVAGLQVLSPGKSPVFVCGGNSVRHVPAGVLSSDTCRTLLDRQVSLSRDIAAQLAQLQAQNRQQASAIVTAARSARASASPLRHRGSGTRRRTDSVPPTSSLPSSPPRCTSPQLRVSIDNACAQPNQESDITTPRARDDQNTNVSCSSWAPRPETMGGWGRSALLRREGAKDEITTQESTTRQPPSSVCGSICADRPSPGTNSWGRSSLLRPSGRPSPGRNSSESVSGLTPSQTTAGGSLAVPLSAPATAGSSRSSWTHEAPRGRRLHPPSQSLTQHKEEAQQSDTSPVTFNKGSLIYILGTSVSSVRAKSLARQAGWG